MTIEIKPEVKAAIDERLKNGRFHDVDELLAKALQSLPDDAVETLPLKQPKRNLAQFLLDSPLPGSGLQVERQKDSPRPVEL